MNKTEIIEDYKVKYRKYLFSKSIKVTRSDEDSILVTMPYFCTYKRAKEFLLSVFDKVKTFKFEKAPDNNLKELKKSAKNYLPKRIEMLAVEHGFKYNKLALRNQKTRFGSCSYKNNINLNINLMNYDKDVIDYVIIHELVHTKIKNHSKEFWNEVEQHCPDYKALRKRLRNNTKK